MNVNKFSFISPVDYPEDLIHDANYIYFDPTLWVGAHYELEKRSIPYHLIGLNVFDNTAETPTLIELNKLSQGIKEQLWEEIGAYKSLEAFSKFDQMSMFQNYIKSNSNLEQMKQFLADMMRIDVKKERYLFRYFDPRVVIHLNALFDVRAGKSIAQSKLFSQWKKHIDTWKVSIGGGFYQLNFPYVGSIDLSLIGFDEVMNMTEYFRDELLPQYDDEGELIPPLKEIPFEKLLSITYEKILGENNGFK